jgi:hypothetical protein
LNSNIEKAKKTFFAIGSVFLAAVLLLVNAPSAYGSFDPLGENPPPGDDRVLGVGRIQATALDSLITADEKLSLQAGGTVLSDSSLTTPTSRRVGVSGLVGDWRSGYASAYGRGFIYDDNTTADGTILTWEGMGVAVPAEWGFLVGSWVEIEYGGMRITCKINDTGAFLVMGRDLDLQPGVWKFFGFEDEMDWGVRLVRYRFIR